MTEENLHDRVKGIDWLIEHWKQYQCPDCKDGDRSKCSADKENAVASRDLPDGTKQYYCFVGCLMVDLIENQGPDAVKHFAESQFNREGHYEKLATP